MSRTLVGTPDPEQPRRPHWLAYTVNRYSTATTTVNWTAAGTAATTLVTYPLCVPRRGEPTEPPS